MKAKKFILLLIPVAVLVVLVYVIWGWQGEEVIITSKNLILNSGFEAFDSSGKIDFWKEDAKGGWSVDAEKPYQGERCMRASLAWSWPSQVIPVRAKRHYTLKVYLRSDITIPGKEDYHNTFLTLECLNWRKKVIHREWGIVNTTSSWELKENFISTPPGTKEIRIMLAKRQGEGSIWFDDVKLLEMPRTLVLNPGFEVLSDTGKPEFWKEHPKGGWSVSTQGSYEGERFMRATMDWGWISQDIPVRSKTFYTLRAYVRSDITIPEKEDYYNTFLTLECLDKENKSIKRVWGITNATFLWQLRETVIFTPPETRKIRIKLAKRQGMGSVWFDGLEMIRHRYPPHLWGDKPFFIFYFSIYAILVLSLLRIIFKKEKASVRKK